MWPTKNIVPAEGSARDARSVAESVVVGDADTCAALAVPVARVPEASSATAHIDVRIETDPSPSSSARGLTQIANAAVAYGARVLLRSACGPVLAGTLAAAATLQADAPMIVRPVASPASVWAAAASSAQELRVWHESSSAARGGGTAVGRTSLAASGASGLPPIPPDVSRILDAGPGRVAALEAVASTALACFGEGAELALALFVDPEDEAPDERVVLSVRTSAPLAVVVSALERFDEDFWIDASGEHGSWLTVTTELT